MIKSSVVRLVDLCSRYPWWVIVIALVLASVSGVYAARNFGIKTDINELISDQLPWTQRAKQYMAAFPQREILAVRPDYFKLTGGLERWLYRLARKAVPDKAALLIVGDIDQLPSVGPGQQASFS